jgi:Xaa-Pro dipeptidase
MNFDAVQSAMREQKIDAWLVFDFRNNNPVLARILGGSHHLTRRVFWLRTASGETTLLCHTIDEATFKKLGVPYVRYQSWPEMHAKLRDLLSPFRRVAMEYSPGGALPTAGIVDAGTVELVRSMGVEVASSADLVQVFAAAWRERGLESHKAAIAGCDAIVQEAFAFLGAHLRANGSATEREVQKFIMDRFAAAGLVADSEPIVAVNGNGADCHYAPDEKRFATIKPGDWVLIDLWAKQPGDGTVYGDITWTGYCGKDVPAEHAAVFRAVLGARDAAIRAAQDGWTRAKAGGAAAEGWQLDDAARKVILDAGFGAFIKHRTGHSLSPGTAGAHGIGMNLDNLETRDTRRMTPDTGFTIEPGVYLDGKFGVRSEVNVYVDPVKGPIVTGAVQREVVVIG